MARIGQFTYNPQAGQYGEPLPIAKAAGDQATATESGKSAAQTAADRNASSLDGLYAQIGDKTQPAAPKR